MEDLYKDLDLQKYFWGGAKKINYNRIDLTHSNYINHILNTLCIRNNLKSIGDLWQELSTNQFESLLKSGLQYNLGFTKCENMSITDAEYFFNKLSNNFSFDECKFYTNWYCNPWTENCGSYNSISTQTLDLGICIISDTSAILIYFLFED